MAQAAFPTATDLRAYLTSLSLYDPAELEQALDRMNLAEKAGAAQAQWELETGWQPFLRDSADVTRYYDPPGPGAGRGGYDYRGGYGVRGGGRVLDLEAGLLVLTSLHVGFNTSSNGTALTENQDFFLLTLNAAAQGQPATRVEFLSRQWGQPRSVRIIGRWGYAATVPDDAWQATLHLGAYLCYQELSLGVSRGLYSLRTLNTEARYGGGGTVPLSVEAPVWLKTYQAARRRYQRITL